MAKELPTDAEIEAIFDEAEVRLVQETNHWFLPQLVDQIREDRMFNIRPEYQRRLVWDTKKKSRFIESLLLNIPIAPIFLLERDLHEYEVMDGQQRLNAILEFYDGKLKLTGLESDWKVLNGRAYADFPDRVRRILSRRRLSATVLVAESAHRTTDSDALLSLRREVFDRLNTGGQHLNPQEIRNSIYAGAFNELLLELSCDSDFTEVWGIPAHAYRKEPSSQLRLELDAHPLYRRMLDVELVLRFFAFRRPSRITGSVPRTLDLCMHDHLEIEGATLQDYTERFRKALATARSVFGTRVFQLKDRKGHWRKSQTLYDAVMIGLDNLEDEHTSVIAARADVRHALNEVLSEDKTYDLLVGKASTAVATRARIRLVTDLIAEQIG